MKSLEKQLAFALTLSLTVIFVLFWWVMTVTIHQLTERYIITRLEHDADTLLAHLSIQEGRWHISENAADVIYQRPESGHYYVVKSALQQNKQAKTSPIPPMASHSLQSYQLYTPLGEANQSVYETHAPNTLETLVLRVPFERDGLAGYLFVAEDHSPIQASLRKFDLFFAMASFLGVGLLLWAQRRILKKGFASLIPVQEALSKIEQGKQAAINTQVPTEIAPLVDSLNQSLCQLQARLERSREATGNLAHALKSPLNLMYQFLDSRDFSSDTQARLECKQQAQRMNVLIERELGQARTAGRGMALKAFELPNDLNDLVQTVQQLYRDKKIVIRCQGDLQGLLPFDREDIFELLGNLLDNAAKWCKQEVCIEIKQTATAWVVIVADDGPGVTPAQIGALQERGTRFDESQPGHGLGLSIVYQVVAAYAGQIDFAVPAHTSAEAFMTSLPLAPSLQGLHVQVKFDLPSNSLP